MMDHILQILLGLFAVVADAVFHARGGHPGPHGVDGSRMVFNPGQGGFEIGGHLVQAGHHDDLLRAKAQPATRLPVASRFTSFPSMVRALVLVII
jgi:hypothetical protein